MISYVSNQLNDLIAKLDRLDVGINDYSLLVRALAESEDVVVSPTSWDDLVSDPHSSQTTSELGLVSEEGNVELDG